MKDKDILAASLVFASSLALLSLLRSDVPKGIRNNNPLNIRHNDANQWVGQIGVDSDGFVIFDKVENGFRAATKVLQSYARRGVKTLEGIISTWAPPVENDTESYIGSVSDKIQISRLEYVEPENYVDLLSAMTFHENGVNPYSRGVIADGVARA